MTIVLNGTTGIDTPGLTNSGSQTISSGTANGVAYLNGSKVLTTGSALQFDGSNLGLGVTPSAWSAYRAFQMQAGSLLSFSTTDWRMVQNVVRTGSTFNYLNNGFANYYLQDGNLGGHAWFTAPSGTAGNAISFTQAMTLDASGNLLVGTTSFTSGGISRTVVVNGASSSAVQFQIGGALACYVYAYTSAGFRVETSSTYPRVEFAPGGSGGVQLASAGATSWTTLSDERTKTDLTPITGAAEKVTSLRAVTGRFKTDAPEVSRAFLIAQDVQAVLPQAVTSYRIKDDDTDYLGLAYTDTIPLLVAAIQEQQALIQTLTDRISALEAK